jgi:hypothetical protein
MYGNVTYIWVIFGVNVGKYSIHGASGRDVLSFDFFTMDSGCLVPAFAPTEKVCANHQTMEHKMI